MRVPRLSRVVLDWAVPAGFGCFAVGGAGKEVTLIGTVETIVAPAADVPESVVRFN
jgi:hypothetical protein